MLENPAQLQTNCFIFPCHSLDTPGNALVPKCYFVWFRAQYAVSIVQVAGDILSVHGLPKSVGRRCLKVKHGYTLTPCDEHYNANDECALSHVNFIHSSLSSHSNSNENIQVLPRSRIDRTILSSDV